jgi:hypothetical protein
MTEIDVRYDCWRPKNSICMADCVTESALDWRPETRGGRWGASRRSLLKDVVLNR